MVSSAIVFRSLSMNATQNSEGCGRCLGCRAVFPTWLAGGSGGHACNPVLTYPARVAAGLRGAYRPAPRQSRREPMRRIVWGRATSSNVMKVLWGLGELNLPFERIDVGGSFGKTDTPEYRAMNPTGLVPTLQEDDFTLWESNAVLRYLCHAHAPHSLLLPQDPHQRANIDRWMDAQQTVLNRPMGVVFWGLVRTPADKRDPAAVAQGVADAAKAYGMIEPLL